LRSRPLSLWNRWSDLTPNFLAKTCWRERPHGTMWHAHLRALTRRIGRVIGTDMNLRRPSIPGRLVLACVLPLRARRWSNCRPTEDGLSQAVLSSSNHSTARTGTISGSVLVNASVGTPPPGERPGEEARG
jgi:hypothetical protein